MPRTHFHRLLEVKLKEVLDERRIDLADGAATDFSGYKFHVGYVQAIKDVLAMCDEINEGMD